MNSDALWGPTASRAALKRRAEIMGAIRRFLDGHGYLEVDVPVLGRFGLHHPTSPPLSVTRPGSERAYLQTSPEPALKRLLAAGYGAVYAFSRAVRRDPTDSTHNAEFTLLEWYVPGLDRDGLIGQVVTLVDSLLGSRAFQNVRFPDLFRALTGVEMCVAPTGMAIAGHSAPPPRARTDRRSWLEWVLDEAIVPVLSPMGGVVLTDYPGELACFAATSPRDARISQRFEIFVDGMEIANGCEELTDADVYLQRMLDDQRSAPKVLPAAAYIDDNLLGAARAGLPPCSGVGVGVDRLVMLSLGVTDIKDVIAFPMERS